MVPPQAAKSAELKSGVFHLRSLTGLRFVAAAAVFVSHIQYFVFPEVRQLPLGGPAVSFFFVLSGFILTYVYGQKLSRQSVPRFWFTRWARLWPLHCSQCVPTDSSPSQFGSSREKSRRKFRNGCRPIRGFTLC